MSIVLTRLPCLLQVITACLILHNLATKLRLPIPDPQEEEEEEGGNAGNIDIGANVPKEGARLAAGKAVRDGIIRN